MPITRVITVSLLLALAACGSTSSTDSGTPDAGTPDSGTPDSGTPDAGRPDAGCHCSVGVCLGDGGCGDCALDDDCPSSSPVCDTTQNVCVECRATPDSCAPGQWCNAGSCAPGCGRPTDCASGVCLPNHECQACRTDAECQPGRLCTSGACHDPCTTTCDGGATCCSGRCAAVGADPRYCSSCTGACSGICSGPSQCAPTALSSVCALPKAVAVLDGVDDSSSIEMAAALNSGCTPSVTYRAVHQADAGFINPVTGYPSRTGETLAIAGGSFFQKVIGWLEQNTLAPVIDTSTSSVYRYSLRDGGLITQGPVSLLSATRDVFVVQIATTPEGVVVVNASGFYREGTSAAAWYFVNTLLPTASTLTDAWYVVDWTDLNVNGVPDPADTWSVVQKGP